MTEVQRLAKIIVLKDLLKEYELLAKYNGGTDYDRYCALELAIKELEQPRREADDYENEIEGLQNRLDIAEYDKEMLREEVTRLEEKIKTLEQGLKTGRWIDTGKVAFRRNGDQIMLTRCSVCGAEFWRSDNYLPNTCQSCGTKMESEG